MRKAIFSLLDGMLSYAPMVVMALLAGATWWLVEITPTAAGMAQAQEIRYEPDYIVDDLMAERFDATGQLRSWMTGDRAKRYPAEDSISVSNLNMMTTEMSADEEQAQPVLGAEGVQFYRTTAIADIAYLFNHNEVIELRENAYVTRQPLGAEGNTERLEFRGDELRILLNEDKMVSDLPVDITQEGTRFIAQRMIYHNSTNTLELLGNVQGVTTRHP